MTLSKQVYEPITAAELAGRFLEAKQTGPNKWLVKCPGPSHKHGDRHPSLEITEKDGKCLAYCQVCGKENLPFEDILKAAGLFDTPLSTKTPVVNINELRRSLGQKFPDEADRPRKIVARYHYTDEKGNLLYQVIRYEPKGFRQRRPAGGKDKWIWNLKGITPVLYRLPQLLAPENGNRFVHVVEGEKDAKKLGTWGKVATCNSGGAGKWKPEYSAVLAGRKVVIIPDNDDAGRHHAQMVADSVFDAGAQWVKIVTLPNAKDFSDWVATGGTREQLRVLVRATPLYQPMEPLVSDVQWPEPLKPVAFQGLAGDIVRTIEPQSEADPAALLIQTLLAFGNLAGRGVHWMAEADKHYTNLFAVIVAPTSKGRKGTSFGRIKQILERVDSTWLDTRMMSGLSTGEGLIHQVRDEVQKLVAIKEKGRIIGYEEELVDEGVRDKRLLIVEPEFARTLQVSERENNPLSAIMRQAWDDGNLRVLTKNSPERATGAHISILAHITKEELQRFITHTATVNGFANRFLWVCSRRSKSLPRGGKLENKKLQPLVARMQKAAAFARDTDAEQRMGFSKEAGAIWDKEYRFLTETALGPVGMATSRAEAQVRRIACIYALLECSHFVKVEHLQAALEVWRYCADSARFIFGEAARNPLAEEIIKQLRGHKEGMTRNQLRVDVFQQHQSSEAIGNALELLQRSGLARMERTESKKPGRPTERWLVV